MKHGAWLAVAACCSMALLLSGDGVTGVYAQEPVEALPGTESGFTTFQARCAMCHANSVNERKGVRGAERAPTTDVIRQMSPERIHQALTAGSMPEHTNDLSEIARVRVAEFMSSRPMGSARTGDATAMSNRCRTNPPIVHSAKSPSWSGWGNDLANTRFQPAAAARLTAAQVPKLKLKWAFGFPAGVSANGQPAIVSGRIFVGSDNGYFYSLDAKTGCVYWSFENKSIVRNAPAVAPMTTPGTTTPRLVVFFGDGHANVYALDAQTGKQLWKTRVDSHFVARITAGVKFYNGRLFVPVSSSEELTGGSPGYSCCTARGSVAALDAATGKLVWKAWSVADDPEPYKTMANGVVLYRPAGGAVWNSPTIDPARSAVYFGTGNATTAPAPSTTDAIVAVNIDTGKPLWSYQTTSNDVFIGGCSGTERSEACPAPLGPHMDIGNSPILLTMPDGKRLVLAGTKSGDVVALDPDNMGSLVYRVNAAGGPINVTGRAARGSIVWGGTTDGQQVYYGAGVAGLVALQPATGEIAWTFRGPPQDGSGRAVALGAAPTAMPGVVFEGAADGRLFAVSSADGKLLWQFNTAQEFKTVNSVTARGGAIASSGAVVVDGMVYVGSGYAVTSGAAAGNVLLAFSID